MQRLSEDSNFKEGALYAGKNALIYDSVQEEGNIYTVLKNSNKKYVDNFEVIKGELFYFSQNEKEKKWAQEIGIKVSPYIIIDGELMSAGDNLGLMDEVTGSIIIPQSVTKIGEGAFSNLEGLKTIVIPGTVKEIGMNAFKNNKTLEKVIIQEGVEKIGESAFERCTNLKTIELPESITEINKQAFYICQSLQEIEIPSKITRIDSLTFGSCPKLAKVTFRGDKLKQIIGEAFYGTSFSDFRITKNVETISAVAFTRNTNLTNITVDSDKFVYENGMLMPKNKENIIFISQKYYEGKAELTIPEGVTIFNTSISDLNTVRKLIITSKVRDIPTARYLSQNLEEIEVVSGNTTFAVSDKCLYTTQSPKRLVYCFSKDTEITLNVDVEIIGDFSFYGATNARKIILNDTVKTIYNQVFYSRINEVVIGKRVDNINSMFAFQRYNLKVTIDSENPNYIMEDGVLYTKDKSVLKTVIPAINGKFILDDKVQRIENSAFYAQAYMTEIDLKNVKEIGSQVFYECSKLTKIEIPNTIESIASSAFDSANNLGEIIINKPENSISGAPWGCPYGLRAIKWQSIK